MEAGQREISATELVKLATLLAIQVSDLVRSAPPLDDMFVELRADHDDVDLLPALVEFRRLVEDYLGLEDLLEMPLPRREPASYEIDKRNIDVSAVDIAVQERDRLALRDGPIADLAGTLETDVGIRIFYMSLPSRLAGFYAYNQRSGACIAINVNHPRGRQVLTLAHEYGHFLTRRHNQEVTRVGGYARVPARERFANEFALEFLMPRMGLRRRLRDLVAHRNSDVTVADLVRLKDYYRVSFEAMMLRLETIGILKPGTYTDLRERGFRVTDAERSLDIEGSEVPLLPTRYEYLAVLAFFKELISESEFARLLRRSRLDARSVANRYREDVEVQENGFVEKRDVDISKRIEITVGAT
jgi:Zn-dependent peptidase ImmA (M78 family)